MPAPTHTSQFYIKINGADVPEQIQSRIVNLQVDSALGMPSMCILDVMDDELASVDDSTMFKFGNSIEVGSGENIDPESGAPAPSSALFSGEITAIEPVYLADGKTRLIIRGYDKSHRLHRNRRTKTYANSTDSDIIKAILGANGISPQLAATTTVHDHVYQHNETDFEMVAKLARRNGFTWFAHGSQVTLDKPSALAAGRSALTLAYGSTLREFRPRLSGIGQRQKIEVRGWDVQSKHSIVGRATSSGFSFPPSSGNGVSSTKAAFGDGNVVVHETPIKDQGEADRLASALLDEADGGYVQGEGVALGNPKLLAGTPLTLEGLGNRFSGKYFVAGATHTFGEEGYETRFRVTGLGSANISALLGAGAGTAERVSMHQEFTGLVVGIVTNIDDDQKWGRIKLKFPTISEADESWWARVAQPLAGPERGFYLMPQVNDEVLVGFEHGDFNRPYVVGSLWNGTDKLPSEAAAAPDGKRHMVHILKTGTEARFVIDDIEEFLELTSKGKHYIKIDNKNKKIELKTAGGHVVEIDEQGQKITMKTGNQTVEMATGGITLTGSTVKINSTGTVDIQGSGAVTIKGSTIALN
jgi:phage protein D/phage baseplate assembly protein gpV